MSQSDVYNAILESKKGLSANELMESLGLSRGTIAENVRRLKKRGLVVTELRRSVGSVDGRRRFGFYTATRWQRSRSV